MRRAVCVLLRRSKGRNAFRWRNLVSYSGSFGRRGGRRKREREGNEREICLILIYQKIVNEPARELPRVSRLADRARIIANENTFSLRSMWHEDVLYDCLLSPARYGTTRFALRCVSRERVKYVYIYIYASYTPQGILTHFIKLTHRSKSMTARFALVDFVFQLTHGRSVQKCTNFPPHT